MTNTGEEFGWGHRWAQTVTARPWLSLGVGIALFSLATVPLARSGWEGDPGWPSLQSNFTHTAFFEDDDPLLQRFDDFERRFGNDDAVVLVVHSPNGIFDTPSLDAIQKITEALWKVHDVIRVDSITNFNWVHAEDDDVFIEPLVPDDEPLGPELIASRRRVALEHETIPNYLVTEDAHTAMIYARIKPGIDLRLREDGTQELVVQPADAEKIVTETRAVFAAHPGDDHEYYLTGGPSINYAFQDSAIGDQARLNPLIFGMIILVLVALFRRVGGVLMPLAIIGLSVVTSLAMAGWFGVEFGTITAVAIQIMIAIAVADSVHILATFYMRINEGFGRRDSAVYALAKNALPTLLTSLSTALGFFSFISANLRPITGLGLMAGSGTLMAWLYTYLLLGGLMVLVPTRLRQAGQVRDDPPISQRSKAYVEWLYRWRMVIFGGTGVLLVVSGYLATQVRVNSNPFEYFRPGYFVRDAQDFLQANADGTANFEVVVSSKEAEGIKDPGFMQAVAKLEEDIKAIPGMTKSISMVDIVRQTHRTWMGGDDAAYTIPESREAIAQLISIYENGLPQGMDVNDRMTQAKDALRLTLVSDITDSEDWVQAAEEVEAMGAARGLDTQVTGKNYLYQNMNGYVVTSFRASLTLAVLLISGLLLAVFRSFRLGVMAMIPNLVPLIIGGAVLKAIGADMDIGTVLVASVCLGIAVDDTIHVIANFDRYRKQGAGPQEAAAHVIHRTAPALLVTSAVLIFGFGVLLMGTFVPNVYFGLMTAIILFIAVVVDLTFLPALLMTWDRREEAVPSNMGDAAPAAVR